MNSLKHSSAQRLSLRTLRLTTTRPITSMTTNVKTLRRNVKTLNRGLRGSPPRRISGCVTSTSCWARWLLERDRPTISLIKTVRTISPPCKGHPCYESRTATASATFRGSRTYLPATPDLQIDGLLVDGLAVLEGSDDSERLESLRAFYRHAEAKPWDAAAQLNARFSSYSGASAEITEQHLEDLKTLARLIEDKAVSPSTYSSRCIFVAVRTDGTRYWARPNKVFLDEPFEQTGLASLYESNEYRASWDGRYLPIGRLDPKYVDYNIDMSLLTGALNAVDGLKIVKVGVTTTFRLSTDVGGTGNSLQERF